MTTVNTDIGFRIPEFTEDFHANFYAIDGEGAYATIQYGDIPGVVLSVYGHFTEGKDNVPTKGDVTGLAIGVFDDKGHYKELVSVDDLPKKLDVSLLVKAAAKGDIEGFLEKVFKGDDEFNGSSQDDYFKGYKGDDELNGGKGDDSLDGGAGDDTIDVGPKGADHVVFSSLDGTDTILHFGAGDVLDFQAKTFAGLAEVDGHLDAAMFHLGKKAADGNDFLVYDQKAGKLFYDSDGDGDDKAVLIAKLGKGTELSADDIHLI